MWRIKTSSHTLFELEYICIWPHISLLVAIPHRHQAKETEIPQNRKNGVSPFYISSSISLFIQQNLYFFPLLQEQFS